MIEIDGKIYRNLEEQVRKNKEDIESIDANVTSNTNSINDINTRLDNLDLTYASAEDIENLQSQINTKANQSALDSTNSQVSTNTSNISSLNTTKANQSDLNSTNSRVSTLESNVTQLSPQVAKSLKTPMSAPSSTELVAVDTSNGQAMISIGEGLVIENDALKLDDIEAVEYAESERQKTKNLLGANYYRSGSKFGVNFTVNEDGSITASGTATWNATFVMDAFVLPAGEYFASIRTADGEVSTIAKLQLHYGSVYQDVENQSFTQTDTTRVDFQFYIPNGTTVNETFYIQLEKGTTMTDYEQYYGEIVHEVEIVDVEKVEIVYDKNKTDVNWGYSGGITGQTEIAGKDFSRYKKLIVTAFTDSVMFQYSIILENTTYEIADGYNHAGSGVATSISDILTQYSSQSLVSSDLTKFYHYNVGRKVSASDEFIYENSSSGYIIIRIEGVVK